MPQDRPDNDRSAGNPGRLRIVHEDAQLLVIDKPAGLASQPSAGGVDAASLRVAHYLREKTKNPKARPGLVHRLDRDASGLLVFAIGRTATSHLSGQFREHTGRRRYLAIVRTGEAPPRLVIEEPLSEIPGARMRVDPTGLPARTAMVPLAFDAKRGLALVAVELDTGRMHQIRVHLAWAVGPLLGDRLYGDPTPPEGLAGIPRIALHAGVLELDHPSRRGRVRWVCAPGADFWHLAAGADLLLPTDWADREVRAPPLGGRESAAAQALTPSETAPES